MRTGNYFNPLAVLSDSLLSNQKITTDYSFCCYHAEQFLANIKLITSFEKEMLPRIYLFFPCGTKSEHGSKAGQTNIFAQPALLCSNSKNNFFLSSYVIQYVGRIG